MLKLTDEQCAALRNQPVGEPLRLVDEQTQQVYFLVDLHAARDFAVATLQHELAGALAEADRGEVEPLDVEVIARSCKGPDCS